MQVSYLLFTYNHENYIRGCLESVLESSSDPIEVYIWDNCSTDTTAEIIDSVINAYNGPNKIIFHRSEYNYHPSFVPMNTAMRHVTGDYIVFISGDDISGPDRITKTVDAFHSTGAFAVSGSAYLIDDQGNQQGIRNRLEERTEFSQYTSAEQFAAIPGSPVCFGAALAWRREVFDLFGPLREGPRNADVMIPFRAALLGGNYYIEDPIVYRRLHADTISLPEARKNASNEHEEFLVKERQLSNRLANFVRMTEDAERFISMTRRRRKARKVFRQMETNTLRITSRWVSHRADMAKHGVGIV